VTNSDTLGAALELAWNTWPERVGLVFCGRSMTYGQLQMAVENLAATYRGLDVRRGDRIICQLSNCPEHIVALGAAWMCSAVHVGVDQQLTSSELSSLIEFTGATTLLFEAAGKSLDPFLPLRLLRRKHPHLRIIVTGHPSLPEELNLFRWDSVTKKSEHQSLAVTDRPSSEDPAIIFFTSGTTGKPKAPLGFHGNLCTRWRRLADWLKFSPEDVHLGHLPLAHGFGLMLAVTALLTGGRLVLFNGFSRKDVFEAVEQQRVTVLNGSSTHFRLLIDHVNSKGGDVSSLRIGVGSAAPFPPSLIRSILDNLKIQFMFMYGASEGVGVVTTDAEDMLRGSVGRPAPGSVTILDADRNVLPAGEIGEIAFSRKVFRVRYWAPPTSVASVPEDTDWYYSGDYGRLDGEGRLYVLGRVKHQINRGGLKVDPVEVENALLECPAIADAAVIGVNDHILGQIVCACVVPVRDEAPSLEQLRSFLGDVLASYKLPEELRVLECIPRTRTGKVNHELLQARINNNGGAKSV